ncbi:MAG: hypothetical protein V4463_24795 [Pseudomonadota bacterium]
MLRLWPESIHAGLFGGQCWLQRRGAPRSAAQALGGSGTPAELLSALSSLLDEHGATLRRGTRINILVSDGIGSVITLPWQDALRSKDELSAYAHACFAQAGETMDEAWVMRTEFRQYRKTGIAYALPRVWMLQLLELLASLGLRLGSVMPVSAQAYCCHKVVATDMPALLLLREPTRTSALYFGKEGLIGIDVEPHASPRAGERLMRRQNAQRQGIGQACYWAPATQEDEAIAALFKLYWPDVTVTRIDSHAWSA